MGGCRTGTCGRTWTGSARASTGRSLGSIAADRAQAKAANLPTVKETWAALQQALRDGLDVPQVRALGQRHNTAVWADPYVRAYILKNADSAPLWIWRGVISSTKPQIMRPVQQIPASQYKDAFAVLQARSKASPDLIYGFGYAGAGVPFQIVRAE